MKSLYRKTDGKSAYLIYYQYHLVNMYNSLYICGCVLETMLKENRINAKTGKSIET